MEMDSNTSETKPVSLAEKIEQLRAVGLPSPSLVDALNDLAYEIQEVNRQQSLSLSKEAISLAALLKHSEGEARAHKQAGWLHLREGQLDIALSHGLRSQALAQITGNVNLACGALYVCASVHQRANNISFALRDWFKLLHIAMQASDQVYEANAYSALGILYREQKDYQEALDCYRQALRRYLALESPHEVSTLNNIAYVYARMNDGINALVYARMALDKCPPDWPAWRANILDTLGRACLTNGDTRIALAQFECGIKLYQMARITGQVHADSVIATLYQSAALALRKLGQLDQAAIKLDQALVEAERANDQPLQVEIHQDTASLMTLLGALEMARHHQAKASALSFKLEHAQVVLRERVLKVFRTERNYFGLALGRGQAG